MPSVGALTLGAVAGPRYVEPGEGVGFHSKLAATDLLTKDEKFDHSAVAAGNDEGSKILTGVHVCDVQLDLSVMQDTPSRVRHTIP
jgi:hypothetical protein